MFLKQWVQLAVVTCGWVQCETGIQVLYWGKWLQRSRASTLYCKDPESWSLWADNGRKRSTTLWSTELCKHDISLHHTTYMIYDTSILFTLYKTSIWSKDSGMVNFIILWERLQKF